MRRPRREAGRSHGHVLLLFWRQGQSTASDSAAGVSPWALANLIVDVALCWPAGCVVCTTDCTPSARRTKPPSSAFSARSGVHGFSGLRQVAALVRAKERPHRVTGEVVGNALTTPMPSAGTPRCRSGSSTRSRSKIWSLYRGPPALFSLMLPPRVRSDRALCSRPCSQLAATPSCRTGRCYSWTP